MARIYITFGQSHTHRVNGKTFDCDCVAIFNASGEKEGRDLAWEYFGSAWCTSYTEEQFKKHDLAEYFSRGEIEVEQWLSLYP